MIYIRCNWSLARNPKLRPKHHLSRNFGGGSRDSASTHTQKELSEKHPQCMAVKKSTATNNICIQIESWTPWLYLCPTLTLCGVRNARHIDGGEKDTDQIKCEICIKNMLLTTCADSYFSWYCLYLKLRSLRSSGILHTILHYGWPFSHTGIPLLDGEYSPNWRPMDTIRVDKF